VYSHTPRERTPQVTPRKKRTESSSTSPSRSPVTRSSPRKRMTSKTEVPRKRMTSNTEEIVVDTSFKTTDADSESESYLTVEEKNLLEKIKRKQENKKKSIKTPPSSPKKSKKTSSSVKNVSVTQKKNPQQPPTTPRKRSRSKSPTKQSKKNKKNETKEKTSKQDKEDFTKESLEYKVGTNTEQDKKEHEKSKKPKKKPQHTSSPTPVRINEIVLSSDDFSDCSSIDLRLSDSTDDNGFFSNQQKNVIQRNHFINISSSSEENVSLSCQCQLMGVTCSCLYRCYSNF